MSSGSRTLEVAHIMSGRVRLRWQSEDELPDELIRRFGADDGIRQVDYHTVSRSVVLSIGDGMSLERLQSIVRDLDVVVQEPMPADQRNRETHLPLCEGDGEDEIDIVHDAVPGRARLHVHKIKDKLASAKALENRLFNLPGIRTAQASCITGNVLVTFDPSRRMLCDIIRLINEFLSSAAMRKSEAERPADRLARSTYSWAAAATVSNVLAGLRVSAADGLSDEDVKHRAMELGSKALDVRNRRNTIDMLKEQFISVPNLMLMGAIAVSSFTNGWIDAGVIGAVLILNGVIGYFTERYAEGAIEALRRLGYPQAHVIRSGQHKIIPAADLLPGDIIRLRSGYLIPADARIVEGTLLVDESMLTGESEPVHKHSGQTEAPKHIYEFQNIVFQGTAVADGRARAIVLTTGKDTELGRISSLVTQAEAPRTRLQGEMDHLGTTLGLGTSIICGLLIAGGLIRRQPLISTLQMGISLAVSAVPEGLPVIAITALATGMQRMLHRKVIIRKLPAVEALGSATVLCVDKTGTLTLNRMTVSCYWWEGRIYSYESMHDSCSGRFALNDRPIEASQHRALDAMLRVGVLCSEAKLRPKDDSGYHISGSATEGALLLAACSAGHWFEDLRETHPLKDIHRREEHQQRMASIHSDPMGGFYTAVKGSPSAVIELCEYRMDESGNAIPLTNSDRQYYLRTNDQLSEDGLRVLAFAQGHSNSLHQARSLKGLTWLGFVGLHDPIRPGVADAIQRCLQAGVRVVVLTGDQPGTARAVARNLGLTDGQSSVLEAPELENQTPQEIARTVEQTAVFARVSPEDKLRIVQALQTTGHVVAMTGDGVNDGPALKAADIGVAVGQGSSDVAKELADVVLTENDFESLVVAVEQGRVIFANIRRALRYLVGSNVSELMLSGAVLFSGIPFPFTPVQILWTNLVSDVFPALALVLEPADLDVMRTPPRRPDAPLIARNEWLGVNADAAVMTSASVATYLWAARRYGFGRTASAAAFTTVNIGEAFYTLACRGRGDRGFFSNAALWGSMSTTIGLQFALNSWRPLRNLIGGAPLNMLDYSVALSSAVLPTLFSALRCRMIGRSRCGVSTDMRVGQHPSLPAPRTYNEAEVLFPKS